MNEPKLILEINDDPKEVARCNAQHDRAELNRAWLAAHWPDLLPQARGKFLTVAGQEAFIADTHEEARARARAAHPEDDGALSQYVFPEGGPRIYAYRGQMASVR
jgi:hypothetical protein